MNNYYVYLHITKEDGLPFYVGKGTGNRIDIPNKIEIKFKITKKHDT